jgi:hypothetical protein
MQLEQFRLLDRENKQDLVFETGTYLSSRRDTEYTIELYQLESFYVEVFYTYGKSRMVYIRAFSCLNDLEPYLTSINLSSLLSI